MKTTPPLSEYEEENIFACKNKIHVRGELNLFRLVQLNANILLPIS